MGQLTQEFQQLSRRVIAVEAALTEQGSTELAALLRTVQVRRAVLTRDVGRSLLDYTFRCGLQVATAQP